MLKVEFEKELATNEGLRPLKIDFSLAQGKILAISGESGLGKTTILRVIAGLEDVQAGQITWNKQQWLAKKGKIQIKAAQRPIAMIFQDYALFPNMTVRENIAFAQGKSSQNEAEIKQWLERFDLATLANRLPARLSGGQKQRVAFARAIARKPEILLMDEPLAAMDKANRYALQSLFLEIQAELGFTAIVVSHDKAEIERLADHWAVLTSHQLEFQTDFKRKNTPAPIEWLAEVLDINAVVISISVDDHIATIPFDARIPKSVKIGDRILMKWDGSVQIIENGIK